MNYIVLLLDITSKMTEINVARALVELKTIEDRIHKAIESGEFVTEIKQTIVCFIFMQIIHLIT